MEMMALHHTWRVHLSSWVVVTGVAGLISFSSFSIQFSSKKKEEAGSKFISSCRWGQDGWFYPGLWMMTIEMLFIPESQWRPEQPWANPPPAVICWLDHLNDGVKPALELELSAPPSVVTSTYWWDLPFQSRCFSSFPIIPAASAKPLFTSFD